MIYVAMIQAEKWVKIGFSDYENCQSRIAQLQTGNPYEIRLLLVTPGTLLQEQAIHKALKTAMARIRIGIPPNEWYPGKHPIIKKTIEALRSGANQGLAFLDQYDPAMKQPGQKSDDVFEPNLLWGR